MKKVLICGSRDWTKKGIVKRVLLQLKNKGFDTIIEGECRGADIIARDLAKEMGFTILPFPAKWKEYKEKYPVSKFGMKFKSAGIDRNKQMLEEGKPELVIAFHEYITKSKGTKNMVNISKNAGVKTIIIDGK